MQQLLTRKSIAERYGIHPSTLTKILENLGISTQGMLSAAHVKKLFAHMGTPQEYKDVKEKLKGA